MPLFLSQHLCESDCDKYYDCQHNARNNDASGLRAAICRLGGRCRGRRRRRSRRRCRGRSGCHSGRGRWSRRSDRCRCCGRACGHLEYFIGRDPTTNAHSGGRELYVTRMIGDGRIGCHAVSIRKDKGSQFHRYDGGIVGLEIHADTLGLERPTVIQYLDCYVLGRARSECSLIAQVRNAVWRYGRRLGLHQACRGNEARDQNE